MRQAGQADAGAGARRLVHLAEHQGALGAFAAALLVDAGFDELVIEIVALAGALADAGEHRVTTVRLGDVVDQFLNEHGLADAGAAEQADLAALGVRREQIDDLDAGDENFSFGRLVGVGAARPHESGACLPTCTGPASSIGSPTTLMMRPSMPAPTGTAIGRPVSVTSWPRTRPSETSIAMVRTVDSPRCCATSSTRRLSPFLVSSAFRIAGRWSVELHVDDGADDLRDLRPVGFACGGCGHFGLLETLRSDDGQRDRARCRASPCE